MEQDIRLLIVDDSLLFRKILKDILQDIQGVNVIGQARDGQDALHQIRTLKPDIVTLDVEMPVMDGLATLEAIKKEFSSVAVVMVSSLTTAGAVTTMKALELGALDFITKPDSPDQDTNRRHIESQLKPILNIFRIRAGAARMARKPAPPVPPTVRPIHTTPDRRAVVGMPESGIVFPKLKGKPEILAIGISTGGPKALMEVVPFLPAALPVPVLIVQHMPPIFTQALADSLAKKSKVKVREAAEGDILEAGTVYIAPGGLHMRVKSRDAAGRISLEITDDPPVNHCKPSVDYCFKSLTKYFERKVLAVIMTGMGNDGTTGLRLLKRSGAEVIAQDQATSVVFGMPAEAIKAGVVDQVLPLNRIAARINEIVM